MGTGFSSFSVSQGRVYTMGNTNNTDTIFCLEAGTGKVVWQHSYPCPLDPKNFEGGPCATPTVADGRVYTFSRKGELFCLDAAKGTRHLVEEPEPGIGAGDTDLGLRQLSPGRGRPGGAEHGQRRGGA